jgi:hypothetical protein
MSIDYHLLIETRESNEGILQHLAACPQLGVHAVSAPFAEMPGYELTVLPEDATGKKIMRESFGIAVDLGVTFTMKKVRVGDEIRFEESPVDFIDVTLEILRWLPGDALLSYEFDTPILLRKSGRLTLNQERFKDTPPEGLARIPQPYSLEPLRYKSGPS